MATKIFTREELKAFEKELEMYRVEKIVSGQAVSYINFEQYLLDQHVMVRQPGYPAPALVESQLDRYLALDDKFEQLKALKTKREFAKAKELEELSALESV